MAGSLGEVELGEVAQMARLLFENTEGLPPETEVQLAEGIKGQWVRSTSM